MWLVDAPAERIAGNGIVLQRQRVEDAGQIAEAIVTSWASLQPWLPFASDNSAGSEKHQELRIIAAGDDWDARIAFGYTIRSIEGFLVGLIGLLNRVGVGALEIGYWLDVRFTGRGYATSAAGTLSDAALEVNKVERLEIHCDEANLRSAAIPRRLGFRLDRTVERPPEAPGESGRSMIWIREKRSNSIDG